MNFIADEKALFLTLLKTPGREPNLYQFVRSGNIEVVEWILSLEETDEDLQWIAVQHGQLEIMKWLKERGFKLHKYLSSDAAIMGNYEIIVWLVENDGPVCDRIVAVAARAGNIDLVKYLLDKGYTMTDDVIVGACSGACHGGSLEMAKFVRENGCKWNDQASVTAARFGRQDILQWLLLEGCPMYPRLKQFALDAGQFGIVNWLEEKNL